MIGRVYIFLWMFSVLIVWQPYRSNWPLGSEPSTRTFSWGSEESENTKNMLLVLSVRRVFCFMISLLTGFKPFSLQWDISMLVSSSSGVSSASSTDHYFPLFLILVNTTSYMYFLFYSWQEVFHYDRDIFPVTGNLLPLKWTVRVT